MPPRTVTVSPSPPAVELSGGGGGGVPAGGEQRALAVAFVQRPQDGSADALLDVVLTPSYVYYSGGRLMGLCVVVGG